MLNKIAKKGFTIMELLTVVVILTILVVIVLPYYQSAVIKSRIFVMLPLMRAWHNAASEWRLVRGSNCKNTNPIGDCVQ